MNHVGHDSLEDLKEMCKNTLPAHWYRLCLLVLDDPKFVESPGSLTRHHNYRGGLAQHTLEVAEMCVNLTVLDREDTNRILVAAVFHDYGKIHEYRFVEDLMSPSCERIEATPFRDLVRHVVWSWAFFDANATNLKTEDRLAIGHAMLAHHGRKEWGSPVEPQTAIAHLLHTADMMSMRSQGKENKK